MPVPPNDDWADAIDLGRTSSGTITGTGLSATTEYGEDTTAAGSVWYAWTAPEYGLATFVTDPLTGWAPDDISAYLGMSAWQLAPSAVPSVLQTVEINESGVNIDRLLKVYVVKDVRYWIRLDNYHDFDLSWTFTAYPLGREPVAGYVATGFIRRYESPGPYRELAGGEGVSFVFALSSTTGVGGTREPATENILTQEDGWFITDDIGGWVAVEGIDILEWSPPYLAGPVPLYRAHIVPHVGVTRAVFELPPTYQVPAGHRISATLGVFPAFNSALGERVTGWVQIALLDPSGVVAISGNQFNAHFGENGADPIVTAPTDGPVGMRVIINFDRPIAGDHLYTANYRGSYGTPGTSYGSRLKVEEALVGSSFMPFGLPTDGAWTSMNLIIAEGSVVVAGGWIFPTEGQGMVVMGLIYSVDAGATWAYPSSILAHDHDLHFDPAYPDSHFYHVPYDTWSEYGAVGNGRMVVSGYIIPPDAELDGVGGPADHGAETPRIISCPSSDPSTWVTADIPMLIRPFDPTESFSNQANIDYMTFAGGFFFLVVELPGDLDDAHLLRSLDGITWTEVGMPTEFSAYFEALGSDGSTWVGAGRWYNGVSQVPTTWISTDAGESWALQATWSSRFRNINYDATLGLWLASNDQGVYWSTNGSTWTLGTGSTVGHRYWDLYWDGSQWWASGFTNGPVANAVSLDGKSWVDVPTDFDPDYCVGVRKVIIPPVPPPPPLVMLGLTVKVRV